MSGRLDVEALTSSRETSIVTSRHPSVMRSGDDVYQDGSVIVVGDRDFTLIGIKSILTNHGFQVACTRRSWREIDIPLAYCKRRFLIIFDLGDGNGLDCDDVMAIRLQFPNSGIVVLLDQSQDDADFQPNIAGTNAILNRNVAQGTLLKSLDVVLAGYGVISHQTLARLRSTSRAPSKLPRADKPLPATAALSEREIEILGCIAEGYANKLIARRFTISEATVKIHVRGILRKLNVQNRTQAAIWALQRSISVDVPAICQKN